MTTMPLCAETGLRRCFGNRELYERLLGLFVDEQARVATGIKSALTEQDPRKAADLAHGLVARAGTIGADVLSSLARQLEESLRDEPTACSPEQAAAVEAECVLVLAAVRTYLLEGAQRAAPATRLKE